MVIHNLYLIFHRTTKDNGEFQINLCCHWLGFSLHGIGFVLAPHRPAGTSVTLRVGPVLEPVLACVASVLALCLRRVGPMLVWSISNVPYVCQSAV